MDSTIYYIYNMKTKVKAYESYECDSVTWSTMFRTPQQSQANTTPLTHHRNHDHNKIQQANQRIKTLHPIPTVTCCVLQRSRVGESLTLVFGQLHLVRGEGPAAVRITVHLNNGWLQAEVIAHLHPADCNRIWRKCLGIVMNMYCMRTSDLYISLYIHTVDIN